LDDNLFSWPENGITYESTVSRKFVIFSLSYCDSNDIELTRVGDNFNVINKRKQ